MKSEQEMIQRIRRAARVAEVREALGLSGEEFGKLLGKNLSALGWQAHYDKAKVSRIESALRDLTVEEAAVIARLDPKRRGMLWLAIGGKHTNPAD